MTKAANAVSTCLEIEWIKKNFYGDSESTELDQVIEKFVKNLPKEKPMLLFFGSSKNIPQKEGTKKRKLRLTKPAKKSLDLADAFNDKSFKIQVALKFFNCYDIDVSDISEADCPIICHENAPILVIYYNRAVIKTVTSGSSNRLYVILSKVLKDNSFNIENVNRQVNKPLRAFYDIERKLYFKESEKKRISGEFAKDPNKSRNSRLDKIKQEYSEVASKRDECKANFIKALKESLKQDFIN